MFAYTKIMQGIQAVSAAVTDAYFNLVTLLLPGNGTNGAQNNTFLDSSTNNFTITRNGNTTQGTFSPFSQTGWSNYFNGSSYLSAPTNAAFDQSTGDFCFEAWFNQDSRGNLRPVLAQLPSQSSGAWRLSINNGSAADAIQFVVNVGGSWTTVIDVSVTWGIGTWNHVAITRSGSTIRAFNNGTLAASATFSSAVGSSTFTPTVGYIAFDGIYFTGYISNARIVKGYPIYTAAFTPSTTPLTAVTGTSLLTCQSNRFIDNSSNSFAITVNGTPSVQAFSPFAPTAAYSAATNGGSGYFDGTGDYLSIADSTAFDLPGDFTLEGWVYFTDVSTNNEIFGLGQETSPNNGFGFYWAASTVNKLRFYSNGATVITCSTTLVANTWYHVAIVRSGSGANNLVIYVNGVSDGSATNTTSFTGTASNGFAIGAGYATSYTATYSGYISSARLVKGQALTSGSFTIPTAPVTTSSVGWTGANAASSLTGTVSLLTNFTNGGIIDATGKNALETVGNAQISTTQSKFGGSSMYFDGTGDYLFSPVGQNYSFPGDFTIECWINTSTTSTEGGAYRRLFATGPDNAASLQIVFSDGSTASGSISVVTSTFVISGNINAATGNWVHVALCRSGSSMKLFIDGVQSGSTATTSQAFTNGATYGLYVGSSQGGTGRYLGYIDDFRISKYARYTGNFSVPTAQFAYNQGDINVKQWVPTNFSVTAGVGNDSLVDSPTNYGTDTGAGGEVRGNYATFNPLIASAPGGSYTGSTAVVQNGALSLVGQGAADYLASSTMGFPTSGKWYCEITLETLATTTKVYRFGMNTSPYSTSTTGLGFYINNGGTSGNQNVFSVPGTSQNIQLTGLSYTQAANDVLQIAYDADTGKAWVGIKNQWVGTSLTSYTGAPATGTSPSYTFTAGTEFFPFATVYGSGVTASINFGQRPFAYTAPSGFKALCTQNLPTPAIGASASTLANKNFDINLWTGTGASQNIVNAGAFAPDFVWTKPRSAAVGHTLFDTIRGATKYLQSNTNGAEGTSATSLTAFNSNGFTVNSDTSTGANGSTYVGWQWNAGGNSASNTAGTISSTVRANAAAGISIVSYTGTGANATVGHGLGVAPKFVIVKNRTTGTRDWECWHTSLTSAAYRIRLNVTAAQDSVPTMWNSTAPTSSVFSIGTDADVNASANNYVAYCFAEVAGFSKFGSYVGNGNADGPFVYCGFRPRYVMLKRADVANDWIIYDTVRNTYNVMGNSLAANTSGAESALNPDIDILSNGFKLRTGTAAAENASGGTYIFAAFAESPFNYARAR